MSDKITQIIEKTVKAAIKELKNSGMIKDQKTPYQKTEMLLYNYRSLQDNIIQKELQIKTIQEEGVPKRSASITSYSPGGSIEVKDEMEKAEDMIQAIQGSIRYTTKYLNLIGESLSNLQNDPYYEIIPMTYFERLTREDIAEFFQCDVGTVSRNKSRLINKLQIQLFSDEFIYQIFN
jgi:DNA-directed RNA polymerase specialized sigma subunit